jgi:hypothetical protein
VKKYTNVARYGQRKKFRHLETGHGGGGVDPFQDIGSRRVGADEQKKKKPAVH